MRIHCPNCQSENMQTAVMVIETGTARTHSSTQIEGRAGNFLTGTSRITGVSTTSGTQSTLIARRFAAPEQKNYGEIVKAQLAYIVLMIFTALLAWLWYSKDKSYLLLAVVAWAFGISRIRAAQKKRKDIDDYNATVFPGLYEKWHASWLCHKCGYFGPVESTTGPS